MTKIDFTKLETYLKSLQKKYDVPFCGCKVLYKGQVVFDGWTGPRYEDKHLYFIYSMSKLVTSVAAMKLVEQGKLSMEDEVSKYLPEYKDLTVKTEDGIVPAKKKMTVLDLLSMQGGYDYEMADLIEAGRRNPKMTTRDMIKLLAERPLNFEPGEGYAYSLCYDVLGAVMEVASGMSLGEYMKQEIFTPLEMHSATMKVTEEVRKHLLPHYSFDAESGTVKEILPPDNYFIFTPEYESGGAGIIASFEDYFKFFAAMVNGGIAANGYRLLKKESMDEILKRRMTDKMIREYVRGVPWECHYAFGVRVLMEPVKRMKSIVAGSFELSGAAGSYAHFDMENELGILYFQHALGIEPIPEIAHHDIRDMVYEAIEKNKK
ncbi:MAG: beta-lactamase family protein [Lachnospiraceae bacterium]|nr:beta-lactamase family protein [Lachnospiraceae bacterium]